MENLPDDVWLVITRHISIKDLLVLKQVNKMLTEKIQHLVETTKTYRSVIALPKIYWHWVKITEYHKAPVFHLTKESSSSCDVLSYVEKCRLSTDVRLG